MEQQASDTPVQVPTEDGKMEPEEQDHLSTVGDEVTVPSSQSTGPAEEEHQEPRFLGDAVLKEDVEAEAGEKEPCSAPQEEEDIMDIPLDDPEANKAAAKIQAGFRGHMTRKKMKPEDEKAGEESPEDQGA
ncbi:uncharacterized protein LOC124477402 isoform X2 [Hypomesus transpacificus]|uniref:uncharacterized protein LOC124477402 isoform X2 n=1 Tax=Hypomesus transpacificus TaxID=137520 RepID=UPI001F086618|nr:uncharacterized protein LOC124477402 isoform X2 [Hypomesus transpacificus]